MTAGEIPNCIRFERKLGNSDIQSPFDLVVQSLGFPNEDEEFWWRATASSLYRLLANCEYTKENQLAHLLWYHRFIIPALGPRPRIGVKPRFQPCPVFDGSACELSINWKELDPARTVRFTIEATGPEAGTAIDPFNQEETKILLRSMAKEVPDLDLKQFEHFANELFISSEAAETLIPKIPAGTPLSQVWVAFDLLRGKVLAKVYFMPILKWIQTQTPTKTLVFDAARKCNGKYGSYDTSIALLDSYLESFPSGKGPSIEMVAIDCVDSPNSRIKFYLRTAVNTLGKAKETYALGGRLSGEVIELGLKALSKLWPILFRLKGDDIENVEVFPKGSYCGYAIEAKSGSDVPDVKIHIPIRKSSGTDAQIRDSLATWFVYRGQDKFAAAYKKDLAAAL